MRPNEWAAAVERQCAIRRNRVLYRRRQSVPGTRRLVARLVGIEGGVVPEVINLESFGVGAPDRAMGSNITKTHSPQCEGETAPSFSTIGSIESGCANERGSSSTRRETMVRPSIAIENCISINGFSEQVRSKAPAHVPAQLPPRSRSPAIPAPAKSALIFHIFSHNRDSMDIGRARLIREPRHSLLVGKRSLSQTASARRLPLARDYEKRIDVIHAMILVAMGGNLIRRNTHPGCSKQTLRCAVALLVWFPTMSDMQRYSGRAIVAS